MRPGKDRIASFGAVGLLLWLIAQWIAFGLGAGGHGWLAPFFFTLPLLLLYPLASVRFFASEPGATKLDWVILLTAVLFDLLLALNALLEERSYFLKAWAMADGVVALWLVFWLGWQGLALATMLKGPRDR
jgi:hypothetical protein